MPDEVVAQAPPTAVTTDATDADIPSAESGLADHEAAFGAIDPTLSEEAKTKAEAKQQRIRHRAKSQQAGPGDVGRISELTRRLRETEAERDTWKTKAQPPQVQSPARDERPHITASSAPANAESGTSRQAAGQPIQWDKLDEDGLPIGWVPTRPEPTEDEVGTKYPLYSAMTRAQAFWVQEQLQAVNQARTKIQEQYQQQEQVQRQWHDTHKTYYQRVSEFEQQHPDFSVTVNQHVNGATLPPAAYKAIIQHDNGPALVYHLAQHPALLTEMQLFFDGKPPSETYVALATQWLSSRAQAVVTGSAASTPPIKLAARPPNPVRAGAAQTSDELPGEDGSLAQHEHAFGKRRRA